MIMSLNRLTPGKKELVLPDSIPGVDLTAALLRIGGNKALFVDLLNKFIVDFSKTAKQISDAIGAGEYEAAHRSAHTVKGVAGNIVAGSIQSLATELDNKLKLVVSGEAESGSVEPTLFRFGSALEAFIDGLKLTGFGGEGDRSAGKADNVEGTLEELTEILSAMRPSVEKRQPKPCKLFIKMLTGKSWPESVAPAVADLNTMIMRYKFKEALEFFERLMEKLHG